MNHSTSLRKKRGGSTMSANKVFRDPPLWATLVGASLAATIAVVASFFVFAQSGEAAPQAADERSPHASASITPWILGGTEVPNGKYPFMAFIEINMLIGGATCEGTLIDQDSVLTAAHCLENSIGARVVVGATDLRQSNKGQIREAGRSFVHPRFDPTTGAYDAGVLKLRRAVTGIQPIKLATARENYLEKPGRILSVAGWGVTRAKGAPVTRMREVSVPVISDSRAERGYDAFYGNPSGYVSPLMIAAGKQGKSACVGDSGAPLFASGGRSTQVGIVSGGRYKCGTPRYPAVYTEVNNPEIRNWILRVAKR
jgi:secreted trypsin-like serine protease